MLAIVRGLRGLGLMGPEPVDARTGQGLAKGWGHPVRQLDVLRGTRRETLDMSYASLAPGHEGGEQLVSLRAWGGHVFYGRPMPISVTTSEAGGVNIVHVSGEIDVASAAVLRDALEALIADGRRRLTLDLGGVTFMDSTGLGIVVGRLKKLARHGGTLTVAASHERVLRVFAITGLDQLIDIHPELEGAVRAAGAAAPAG